jgi:hypothetical protein
VSEAGVGHLRTHRGDHEIDLVVERDDGRVVAIEIKLSTSPVAESVRHLDWLSRQIGDELLDAIVVTTGAPGTLNRGRARRSALPGRSQSSRRGKRRRPASRRCGDNGDASPLREIVGRF